MATLNYQFVRVCAGGCHVSMNVSLNGGAPIEITVDSDFMRAPLSSIDVDDRDLFTRMLFKIHSAGLTRAQIRADVQAPGGLTVTI